MSNPIFVFTTTLLGVHMATTSGRHAVEYYLPTDACFGASVDCFAIPTLDIDRKKLPLYRVMPFVHELLLYARRKPHKTFFVSVFENHTPEEIAPLFKEAPNNILLPPVYEELL